MIRAITASFLAVLACDLCHADDQPKDKFAELQGTWTIVKRVSDLPGVNDACMPATSGVIGSLRISGMNGETPEKCRKTRHSSECYHIFANFWECFLLRARTIVSAGHAIMIGSASKESDGRQLRPESRRSEGLERTYCLGLETPVRVSATLEHMARESRDRAGSQEREPK